MKIENFLQFMFPSLKKQLFNKGFTLVETLLVLSIVSLISSVVYTELNKTRIKVRDARRMSDLEQIATALERYYEDYGYYPQSDCGWDCNGYRYSYNSSWTSLANNLNPYISPLPLDPLNSPNCPPWQNNCYTYAYGNVGRNGGGANAQGKVQYDLAAQLEDTGSIHRCSSKQYVFYFDDRAWCGPYPGQIYEKSD